MLSRAPLVVLLFAAASLATQTAPAPGSQSAPPAARPAPAPPTFKPTPEMLAIEAASKKEHQRELDLLGIKELHPGVDSNQSSPHPANFDESKADVYPNLPDPLLLNDGKPVTTARQWWTQRRPQIVALFDEDILGRTPAHLPNVTWEVVSITHEQNGDVPIVTKKLVGHVDNSADPAIKVDIDLELSTPENAAGPVPVIMELGFSREFMEQLRKRFPQFANMNTPGPTWQQQVLAKGWGYAEYVPTSVQPDNGAGLDEGIIGLVNKGRPRSVDDWGALKAWAWGASKCLDYFATDPAVDARQVGIEGHSRYGKASLVAMAYDPRFAIGYISSSGEAGAKLYRHVFGEEVSNVASWQSFHWMGARFMRYAGPLNTGDLPVDAHELIALCAPRPVFISGGATNGDGWVDAKGMFLAAAGAGPVYRLLGKKDLGTTTFPPIETALISGDIAFRQHTEGHTPAPNWPFFIQFASRYLLAPSAPVLADDPAAPVELTAAEDRFRLLRLLGLSQIRPPQSGDAKSPNSCNYDEAKANPYPNLPDPLRFDDGARVTTAEEWFAHRRPQIQALYDREVLGKTPANLPNVSWKTVAESPAKLGGVNVTMRNVAGHVDNSIDPAITVDIQLLLAIPAHARARVPVVMELEFPEDFDAAMRRPLPEAFIGPWAHYSVDPIPALQRGWAFAMLKATSIQADDGAGLTQGIIGLMNHGQPRSLDDWGALKAWAWGASRCLDYFSTEPALDARRVALEGHSRYGKAVLVAMAYDPRFAIAYSSSSGEGGAKLYRHIYGEPIPNLASTTEYHWMAGNFLKYDGKLNAGDLPVDNHELIALSAPRPIFIGSGSNNGDGYANPNGDAWADPRGMFLAEVAATPVYRLLGVRGLETSTFPPIETALVKGNLAFRQHSDGHTPKPNWPAFLDFASRFLGPAGRPATTN
jgi:hypothetical protein